MLITNLIIEISNDRDLFKAGQISEEEYHRRKDEHRAAFREKEEEQYQGQVSEIVEQVRHYNAGPDFQGVGPEPDDEF